MANTSDIPSPTSGNLQIQRIIGGHRVSDELGEEPANFCDGLDLGSSPISSPSSQ